jgi:hypothetical protein
MVSPTRSGVDGVTPPLLVFILIGVAALLPHLVMTGIDLEGTPPPN